MIVDCVGCGGTFEREGDHGNLCPECEELAAQLEREIDADFARRCAL